MLYHISLKFWKIIERFSPRIPQGRLDVADENSTIPRICLSNSLEGCLTGASWGGYHLISEPPYEVDDLVAIARVYQFDKADINKENLLYPQQIKKYVPDSLISQEHWVINQSISPEKSFVIILRNFYFDFEVLEHKGEKYKIYKIEEPEYDVLTEEQDRLLVGLVNIKDARERSAYREEHKAQLSAIL